MLVSKAKQYAETLGIDTQLLVFPSEKTKNTKVVYDHTHPK